MNNKQYWTHFTLCFEFPVNYTCLEFWIVCCLHDKGSYYMYIYFLFERNV